MPFIYPIGMGNFRILLTDTLRTRNLLKPKPITKGYFFFHFPIDSGMVNGPQNQQSSRFRSMKFQETMPYMGFYTTGRFPSWKPLPRLKWPSFTFDIHRMQWNPIFRLTIRLTLNSFLPNRMALPLKHW